MNAPAEPGSDLGTKIIIIVKTAIVMKIPTKSLKNPDNRIKLFNVLLGKSQGRPVANL